ncbi:MAG TPA: hypothetical protein P5205_00905 [Candidatus Paceibacterota bacterium]|nr:hypothetical protein [Verrucomicrobiota bacterium]HSA08910.1 hypothetical protein [Candidatus Paceibacterota bacterium]
MNSAPSCAAFAGGLWLARVSDANAQWLAIGTLRGTIEGGSPSLKLETTSGGLELFQHGAKQK